LATPISHEQRKPRWFDGTVNLPTIIAVITTLASVAYFGITQISDLKLRLSLVEMHDQAVDDHFRQVEKSQDQLRQDLSGQLHDINAKLDRLIWPEGYDRNDARDPRDGRR
jgi:hypothetical protein